MTFIWGNGPVSHGIQGLEWIIILIVLAILFIFGPQKIPQLMRGLGRGLGEFQKGKREIETELKREMSESAADEERMDFERNVVTAGKSLGVEVDGRGQKEIKLEIAKRIDDAERADVVSVAKTLGVSTEGVELPRLREGIVKKLGV